jgi:hypothetical protein
MAEDDVLVKLVGVVVVDEKEGLEILEELVDDELRPLVGCDEEEKGLNVDELAELLLKT